MWRIDWHDVGQIAIGSFWAVFTSTLVVSAFAVAMGLGG